LRFFKDGTRQAYRGCLGINIAIQKGHAFEMRAFFATALPHKYGRSMDTAIVKTPILF